MVKKVSEVDSRKTKFSPLFSFFFFIIFFLSFFFAVGKWIFVVFLGCKCKSCQFFNPGNLVGGSKYSEVLWNCAYF